MMVPVEASRPDGSYEFVLQAKLNPWVGAGERLEGVESFLAIRLM